MWEISCLGYKKVSTDIPDYIKSVVGIGYKFDSQ